MTTSKITVEIELAYDPDHATQHDAQQAFLSDLLRESTYVRGTKVTLHSATITNGLVDADDVPFPTKETT